MITDQRKALDEQRKMWSVHKSVQGVTYYFNKILGKSQWEIPDCLKSQKELQEHPDWKVCKSSDGRTFYHNVRTNSSVWQQPAEVKVWKDRRQLQFKKKQLQTYRPQIQQNTDQNEKSKAQLELAKDEQRLRFFNCLKQKGVNVHSKWDQIKETLGQDPRFDLMDMRQKKKIFNSLKQQLKDIQKEQAKIKAEINKHNFVQMLRQRKVTSEGKYHKIRSDFINDSRWKVLDEEERIRLFQDHLDDLFIKQTQIAKLQKKTHMDALRKQLQRIALPHSTRWVQFSKQFQNRTIMKSLHPYQQLTVFTQYMEALWAKMDQKNKTERKQEEKLVRIKFRKLLIDKLLDGNITHKTKWRHIFPKIRGEKLLEQLMDQGQTVAFTIFSDLMDEVRQLHSDMKGKIKEHFSKVGFKISEKTEFQEFKLNLQGLQAFTSLSLYQQQYCHYYFISKMRGKYSGRNQSKPNKHELKQVYTLLDSIPDIDRHSAYFAFLPQIQKLLRSHNLEVEEQRLQYYFYSYIRQKYPDQRSVSRSPSRSPRRKPAREMSEDEEGELRDQSQKGGESQQAYK